MWIADDKGEKIWINVNEPMHQALNPIKTEFMNHKKEIYKLAVLDVMKKKQMADDRRNFIYQREWEIFQIKQAELKNLRLKMMF